jgi:hypothetical protein
MDKSSCIFLKIRVNPRSPRYPRSNYTKLSKLTWVALKRARFLLSQKINVFLTKIKKKVEKNKNFQLK